MLYKCYIIWLCMYNDLLQLECHWPGSRPADQYEAIQCTTRGGHNGGVLCKKQVSRAGTSNYIPQYLWDVITCPCLWYLFWRNNSGHNITWGSFWQRRTCTSGHSLDIVVNGLVKHRHQAINCHDLCHNFATATVATLCFYLWHVFRA